MDRPTSHPGCTKKTTTCSTRSARLCSCTLFTYCFSASARSSAILGVFGGRRGGFVGAQRQYQQIETRSNSSSPVASQLLCEAMVISNSSVYHKEWWRDGSRLTMPPVRGFSAESEKSAHFLGHPSTTKFIPSIHKPEHHKLPLKPTTTSSDREPPAQRTTSRDEKSAAHHVVA